MTRSQTLVSTVDELRSKNPSKVPDDVTPEAIVSVDDDAVVPQPYMSDQEIVDQICVETPDIIVDEDDDDVENGNDVEEENQALLLFVRQWTL